MYLSLFFFFNDTATTEIYTLSLHDALPIFYVPAVDRLVARVPNAATLKKHIIDSHTAVEDCARVATAAGVKTLVLSHLVPADDPTVTEETWLEAAPPHLTGRLLVARGLPGVR